MFNEGGSWRGLNRLKLGIGLWIFGSIPNRLSFLLSLVFQWFLISLSVLPGSSKAIYFGPPANNKSENIQ